MTFDWADQMEQHSTFFREVWADEGIDYLMWWFDGDLGAELHSIDTRIRLNFIDFASGRIDDTRTIMTKLENADLEILRNYGEHINGTKDRLTFWTGDAATNFNDYLNALEGAMEWNRNCIWATWRAMNAYLELQKAFRARILDLVQATQDALDVVEAEEEARSARIQIAIVSAVVTVGAAAAAIPTAGASLGAAWAGVGAALVDGGAAHASIEVGGSHKGEVICNMVDEADKIIAEASEASDRVEQAFFKVTEYLTNVKDNNLIDARPERPDIITDPSFDPDEFHPFDQPPEDREGMSRDDLVVEPERDADPERDHYLQDPKDREYDIDWLGPLPMPEEQEPERGPDAYEEQGLAGPKERGR